MLLLFPMLWTGPNCGWLQADEPVDFARDIRPILSNACFHCHGPDEDARQADLRLDTRDGLVAAPGEYGPVVSGNPEESELARRILSDDPYEQMPPPESNKSLTEEERQLLVRWIEEGANWELHWSFIPPSEPLLPTVSNREWGRNAIDRFTLAALEGKGLSPGTDADPYLLVRRLYLDLIGLPPQTAEADRWVRRLTPGYQHQQQVEPPAIDEAAYQELVSHLLNSPSYGERWARRWLDLARYADTNGYEKDRERSIWPYRDWVVSALNQDMTFDQFTIEQIAGDMLPDATLEQQIATGFHRNTMLNEEGGIDPLEFRYHAMTDRVATTGTTWLGLTLGCCQCHTHKYDPITHTEYFQLMALMNNADEPTRELPDAQIEALWRRNREQADKLVKQLPEQWPLPATDSVKGEEEGEAATEAGQSDSEPPADELGSFSNDAQLRKNTMWAAFDEWLGTERQNVVQWFWLYPTATRSNLPILTIEREATVFASGDTAKRDDYYIEFAPQPHPITALQLEALPDERLPERGPGSTYYEGTLGDFFLGEFRVLTADQPLRISDASETFAQNRFGKNPVSAKLAVDGDVQTGWSVHGRQGERHVAVFVLDEPLPPEQSFTVHMVFGRHFASSLGRFRLSATAAGKTPQARNYSSRTLELLQQPTLSPAEREELLEVFLLQSAELDSEAQRIRELRTRPALPTTLVLGERPADHSRPTYRHHRGEYLQAAEQVSPDVPSILPPLPQDAPRDRLAFAYWLVSPENPLTARVVVNRHWAAFFGTGLVKTVEDFGLQGDSPSHPELLDWLALRFMLDDQWSIKRLHRRIVSSRTYRLSTRVNPSASEIDPENRLLSFAPRLRLDAEVIRDSLLSAAGVLSDELGGPPVKPPQPAGITEVAFGSPKWNPDVGHDRYRRSLYTYIKRTAPFAMFATFDAPSGEACIAQRSRSNSPLQALTMLNDVMLLELSRLAGERFAADAVESSHADVDESEVTEGLAQLFRAVLTRPPQAEELQLLEQFYLTQLARFEKDPRATSELLGKKTVPHPAASARQAAWTATVRALFALDETQNRP